MRRLFLLFVMTIILMAFFTSCGDKNDKIINKFETIIRKMEKIDDPLKKQTLVEQAQYILEDLDTANLSKKQEEKLIALGTDFVNAYEISSDEDVNHDEKSLNSSGYDNRNLSSKDKMTFSSFDLSGAVYKYPITMHLEIEGNSVKGVYYYNKRGPNAQLSLSGTYKDGEMDLYETDEKGRSTGHFKGYMDGDSFKGQFYDSKGKTLNFMVSEMGTSVDEALAEFEEGELPDDFESLPDYGDDEEVSIDEFVIEYEKFWKKYMSILKKAQKSDPTALMEYMQMLNEANEYALKLQKLSGKMNLKQYEKLNRMNMELMQEISKISQ